jgi:hypothetical protein
VRHEVKNLRNDCGDRLPASGRQSVQIVAGGHRGQSSQDIAKVSQGVDVVAGARGDDRVDDRGALARLGMADEQKILLTKSRPTDGVFDQVIVEPRAAVIAVRHQCLPLIEQVSAGLAERGFRAGTTGEQTGGFFQKPQGQCKVALAQVEESKGVIAYLLPRDA